MVRCQTHFRIDDNKNLNIGTGSDLSLYHDGSNSYIENDTGVLLIKAAGDIYQYSHTDRTNFFRLYYGNGQGGDNPNQYIQLKHDSSDAYLETGSKTDVLYLKAAADIHQYSHTNRTNVFRVYYGTNTGATDYIQLAHDGTNGMIGSIEAMQLWIAGSHMVTFETDGDALLETAGKDWLTTGASIDKEIIDAQKWMLFQTIIDAYENHDCAYLSEHLRRTKTGLNKTTKKMETVHYKGANDLIQVAIACIRDLSDRIELLEGRDA